MLLASRFRCHNGRCVLATERCDGVNNCGDDSDEAGCETPPCVYGACSHICEVKRRHDDKTRIKILKSAVAGLQPGAGTPTEK